MIGQAVRDRAIETSEVRAQVPTFAMVAAGRLVKDPWRNRPRGSAAYLEMLASPDSIRLD